MHDRSHPDTRIAVYCTVGEAVTRPPSPESVAAAKALDNEGCPHDGFPWKKVDCLVCIAHALDAAHAAGKAEGMEAAARLCDAMQMRNEASAVIASGAGRKAIALCRESDAETARYLARATRARAQEAAK